MSLNESIKKYSLKYVHCPHGDLHTGQVMNLVCVDSSCSHRGLICPICRMQRHDTHQILPIKTFLQNIRSMFLGSDNNDDLNNLSDYLRALQTSKKDIISTLRAQVAKLADSFKALQNKIEENFAAVRRNVLIQSSITTKLPSLLTLLTEQNVNKDPVSIQQQFKKYTQLLKYQNQKLKISDKAKALVQSYSTIPSKLGDILANHSNDFIKKLQELPKLFEGKEPGKLTVSVQQSSGYTFSTENKYFDIILEENNKLAKTSEFVEEVGYVFVNQNKGLENQKLVLEIVSNMSDRISVGLGDVQQFLNSCSFINDGSIQTKKESYDFLYSNGYSKYLEESEEESVQENQSEAPFMTGDIVQIQFNGTQITYLNRTTQQKHVSKPAFNQKAKNNLQFVIGLCENDSVRILNQ